jgi:intracellular sulfur oxidation DsrE/DsrF family protein
LSQRIKESTMNRSLIVFAGVTSMLTLVLSTQISISAELGAPSRIRTAASQKLPHRVAVQVDVNDPAVMNLALNNVSNVAQHYRDVGEKVDIEVVAFGPGLHMLRDDTSPVKARIKSMSEAMPYLAFSACGNTRENMTRIEAKEVPLISQAKVVKAGVVRLMELQEQGWTYLRP